MGCSWVSRLRGLGRRGGTRRLKLATTSGGEWRLSVGWAGRQSQQEKEREENGRGHTPGTGVGIINGRVDVAQINLAHESIDLRRNVCWGIEEQKKPTFSCREKLANLDWRYMLGRTWRASCSGRSTMMYSPAGSQRIMWWFSGRSRRLRGGEQGQGQGGKGRTHRAW